MFKLFAITTYEGNATTKGGIHVLHVGMNT